MVGEIVLKTFENYESYQCVVLLFKMCKFSTVRTRSLGEDIFICVEKGAGKTNCFICFSLDATKLTFTQRQHSLGFSLKMCEISFGSGLNVQESQVMNYVPVAIQNNTSTC